MQVMPMNFRKPMTSRRLPLAALAAFAATLFAAPVTSVFAQSFPQYPLQRGGGTAEPNIMFILDDSGSMSFNEMPNPDLPAICRRSGNSCTSPNLTAITDLAYTGNTVYYNPQNEYKPWTTSAGTAMAGGTSFNAVYASFHEAAGAADGEANTIDLANPASCRNYRYNSGAANMQVCGGAQTFFVPKDPTNTTAAYLGNAVNYWRYQIRTVGASTRIVRSELLNRGGLGSVASTANYSLTYDTEQINEGNTQNYYANITDGWMAVSTAASGGGSSGNVRLRVRWVDLAGNETEICNANTNNGRIEDCGEMHGLPSGRFRFILTTGDDDVRRVRLTVTSGGNGCRATGNGVWAWGGCQLAVPTRTPASDNRNETNEIINYATWFSYHRTRMKIAKAGASAAFNPLGDNVRVGYRSTWNRSNLNIPVNDGNSGKFAGTSRELWFTRLFAARGQGGTPLHGALQGAGEYFRDSASTGPYGPEAGVEQLNCRQNFSILTTDGYWNNASNYNADIIGNQDGNAGTTYTHPKTGATAGYTVADPYRDGPNVNYSNTLADVAMYYWKNDLMPDMANFVTPTEANPAFWQHMVTFGISIGLKGTVDQTSVADVIRDGRPRVNGTNVPWPNPFPSTTNINSTGEGPQRIDDLLHAAVNGRGEFIAATSADRFAQALDLVLGTIQARLSSGSNVSINSATFQDGSRIYQATYFNQRWTGDMEARDITEAGGISSTVAWSLNGRIATRNGDNVNNNDYDRRTVLTWSGTSGAAFPTAVQTAALTRLTGPAAVTGANNANYIKGDQSLELARRTDANPNALLRNRSLLVGDIINSSPFYIRDTESIYVGANDGMLHGINALNGDIVFSYVPAGLNLTRLASLSDPGYEHAFFVDGPVVVSPRSLVANTNYLLGTLGRGGKGAFALNVSNPASMGNNSVLWDKTATADNDMGYVLGSPLILRGNNNVVMGIVPNGIDSTNGSAALYFYNMATGAQIAKITAGTAGGNGLSAPRAADVDNDGKVDYIYAGDLRGNVWKFDLTGANPATWGVANSGSPLFTAMDEDGNRQPITGGLALAREYGTENVWVTFGTGRMISPDDLDVSVSGTQSLYGIIDGAAIASRDALTERSIAGFGTTAAGQSVRAFEQFSALPANSRGWYIDLGIPTAGERVVGGPLLYGRVLLIASTIPVPGEGCEPDGGGYLNGLDLFTGTSLANGGGTGSASAFDLGGDGSGDDDTFTDANGNTFVIGSIDLGLGMPTDPRRIGGTVVVCGSDGICADPELADPPGGGGGAPRRLSWRELISGD